MAPKRSYTGGLSREIIRGLSMAFAEAINRRLKKKICLHCNVTNAFLAKRCRKCHRGELRLKAVEARGGTA